jgi:MoxR-like ATPase
VSAELLARLMHQINGVIIGKPAQVQHAVACLLAGGHLLIEDVPGVGKTTLAHTLAAALGLQFARVQFTADLMPADLLGVSIYERSQERFVFHPGPVFTQVLLADEINRAGPRTQSALLEAMEEQQVSIEGETRALPHPFFVIGTQNPAEQLGTYPLPESQLDRFLMRITLGYPDRAAERALLAEGDRRERARQLAPVMSPETLQQARASVDAIHAAPALLDYLQAILHETRNGRWFRQGLSPRAGLGLLRVARANALLEGRDHVSPDDVQQVAVPALAHRLVPVSTPDVSGTGRTAPAAGRGAAEQLQAMLAALGLV